MQIPRITAHRGASCDAPENTLAALRLGFAQGADAGECDVRLTRDGHVVLLHDDTTGRTTGGVDWPAAERTLAELRALDVGAWKDARFAGEKIPTLAEALAVTPLRRRLLIELKGGTELFSAMERAFADTAHPASNLIVMSFDFDTVAKARRRFPECETHWVVESDGSPASVLAARARSAGLAGLNLDSRFPIDASFVAELHAAGLQVHVWTVDDAALARRLAAAGVDSITTNRPRWLRAQLAGG